MPRDKTNFIPPGQAKKNPPPDPTPDPTPTPEPPPPPPPEPLPSDGRIVIDPVTRIEGHLRIEVEVTDNLVSNVWCSGTLFRGIEPILKGRNPEDAWLFTQRLCGVCTYVHGSTSVRCVEDAIGLTIPANARIVRNLLMGAQYLHDHIVHFYHLHALDWVDIVRALDAVPKDTEALAKEVTPDAEPLNFTAAQNRLRTFVSGGQLGPFAGGYWGHPAYVLTPAENLLFATHYLEALRQQVEAARMHAIFGAKNPHLQSLRVGGVTCRDDLNVSRIDEFRTLLSSTETFINTIYLPDVVYLASRYLDWTTIGGSDRFLAYGDFPQNENEPASLFFPQGAITDNGLEPVDLTQITEHVKHSWYAGDAARHPAVGETVANYTTSGDRYSWLKAPRYRGESMEVGPLARMLVAYKSGQTDAVTAVENLLTALGLDKHNLFPLHSTLGRTAARALETQIIAKAMHGWLDDLVTGGSTYQSSTLPMQGFGVGLNEAPRGALGHWIEIQNQQIGNYQLVVPSTWNFGPRCGGEKLGPVEAALIGTPVHDLERPVEILRVVHSFDPCIACAVHVIDTRNDKVYEVIATH